jgi:hypothetical protein
MLSVPAEVQAAHRIAATLIDPILRGELEHDARWSPSSMRWARSVGD